MHSLRTLAILAIAGAIGAAVCPTSFGGEPERGAQLLADTGLYEPGSTSVVRADVVRFSPQYPLWSDGASKRRWLHLPPGTYIDASHPDAWEFPRGTKLWKEFAHGQRVETRLIERIEDGTWRYATYVWNAEGTQAARAPAAGIRALAVDAAPGGRYVVPGEADCRACHEGAAVPVLGIGALQLSPARDPLAPHGEPVRPGEATIAMLESRGWLRNLPSALRERGARIAAPSPEARAALGYLHGNCGHCHDPAGALDGLDLALAQRADPAAGSVRQALDSLLGRESRYRPAGATDARRIALDAGSASTVLLRLGATNPLARMPPL
jgi:hypothetical protein